MAPSVYLSSFAKLRTLSTTVQARSHGSNTLTLPRRPDDSDEESNQYLNGAIGALSESAIFLCNDRQYLDHRLDAVEGKLSTVQTKSDKLDREAYDNFKYIQKQFKLNKESVEKVKDNAAIFKDTVDQQFRDVKDEIKKVKDDVAIFKDTVDQQFRDVKDEIRVLKDDTRAYNLNRLARRLDDPVGLITPPNQSVQPQDAVMDDFPETVEEFYLLLSDQKKLTRLGKLYAVKGWKRWNCIEQDDPRATQYERLDDAVRDHPRRCHRVLAATWGLEYGQLERLEVEEAGEHQMSRKRKANSDTGLRRVRAKQDTVETEISIISSDKQDQFIVRRRTVVSEPERALHQQITLEQVMKEYPMPGDPISEDVHWESTSSAQALRHAIRAGRRLDPLSDDGKPRQLRGSEIRDLHE